MSKGFRSFDEPCIQPYNGVHAISGKVDLTQTEWEALESLIVACRRCPRLVAWRETVAQERRRAYRDEEYWGKPVPGFGDPQARVLIVGLAPGAHGANRTGRLFTGDSSGQFLYSALYRAGFANRPDSHHRDDGMILRDAFLSAACRCVPPANKPSLQELLACRPFLECEIALLQDLRVIVALGRIAFDAVLRLYADKRRSLVEPGAEAPVSSRSPIFGHATVHRLGAARPWLIASFHPSRQNTQTGRLTPAMFDEVWEQTRRMLE
jgi:uracil-DNA glycosylase family 4